MLTTFFDYYFHFFCKRYENYISMTKNDSLSTTLQRKKHLPQGNDCSRQVLYYIFIFSYDYKIASFFSTV